MIEAKRLQKQAVLEEKKFDVGLKGQFANMDIVDQVMDLRIEAKELPTQELISKTGN